MKLIFKTFKGHEQQKKPDRKLGKGLNKIFLKMTSRPWGIEAYASIPSSWIAVLEDLCESEASQVYTVSKTLP